MPSALGGSLSLLFQAGHPWHLETPELEALAIAEQDLRYKTDTLEPKISKYLEGQDEANVSDIMRHFKWDLKDQKLVNRVQKAVTHLEFTNRVRIGKQADGRRPWVYRKSKQQ